MARIIFAYGWGGGGPRPYCEGGGVRAVCAVHLFFSFDKSTALSEVDEAEVNRT